MSGWSRFSPTLHKGLSKSRPLDRAFRRELKEERAFIFYHVWTKNWLLGISSERRGERGIHEFKVLNNDPSMKDGPRCDREKFVEIMKDWNRDGFDECLKRMKSQEHDQFMAEYEWQEEFIRMKQSEAKRVNHVRRQDPYYMLHSHKR